MTVLNEVQLRVASQTLALRLSIVIVHEILLEIPVLDLTDDLLALSMHLQEFPNDSHPHEC